MSKDSKKFLEIWIQKARVKVGKIIKSLGIPQALFLLFFTKITLGLLFTRKLLK